MVVLVLDTKVYQSFVPFKDPVAVLVAYINFNPNNIIIY